MPIGTTINFCGHTGEIVGRSAIMIDGKAQYIVDVCGKIYIFSEDRLNRI